MRTNTNVPAARGTRIMAAMVRPGAGAEAAEPQAGRVGEGAAGAHGEWGA
eukprot:CAMPEP_0172089838 /NCGR_PEP_ID=MMETSP1043-20130122/24031_1 /TAXON_ID=464988 /ORGANISM="Hemiselmis andersenii, Strain CCMP441" /LENGTH=49 /DNA_ID=CAMNT_0012752337 /DNA_START=126 /DNA_END=275 /DNA_ORIENTATION=-